jgi:DNA-binding LacI/PurR family transcriptional regulator
VFRRRKENVSSKKRCEGYIEALKSNSIEVNSSLIRDIKYSNALIGFQETKELMESGNNFSAVIFDSDIAAVGAISAITESGLRIPGDISVVSFDNIEISRYTHPPLTTIDMRAHERGSAAADMIIEIIEKKRKPESKTLEARLVKRHSAGVRR